MGIYQNTLEKIRQLNIDIDKEVDRLRDKYGDFEKQDLLHHAVTNKITNLDAAYAHWQFNDVKLITILIYMTN